MQEIISLTAAPKEKRITAIYSGQPNALRDYNDMNQYKVSLYRILEEMLQSNTKGGKRTLCSVSSGGETQEFRGKLKLTGMGWEISDDGGFEHSSFDVFGALVSEKTDKGYIEIY